MTPSSLTSEERRQFQLSGYLVLADMVPVAEIGAIRRIVEDLLRRKAGRETGDFLDLVGNDEDSTTARLPQLLMPVKYASELIESPLRAIAWSVARDLLGDGVEYQGEHVIAKPPRIGAATPPHQDQAFWSSALDYESVNIWIPLQDVDETNGCLYFAPGSHLSGIMAHRPAGDDPLCNSLELVDNLLERQFEPMQIGALSVHHCRTVHGAGPNIGSTPRFAYIYGFGLPATLAADPREFPWLKAQMTARRARAEAGGYTLTKMRPEP